MFNIFRIMKIHFSKYNRRQSTSLSSIDNVVYLSREQEEADTLRCLIEGGIGKWSKM